MRPYTRNLKLKYSSKFIHNRAERTDTVSIASQKSSKSKRSQLPFTEALKKTEKEVKLKQEMIMNTQQELEEKYKAERAQLEANKNVQRSHQWLQNEADSEPGIDHLQQNSVGNDGSMLRNISTAAIPLYTTHEIN